MFEFGFVTWIVSLVLWLIFVVHPTTRYEGLYWFPIVTMWIGAAFMWIK